MSSCRLIVADRWPDGVPIPPGHVCAGFSICWSFKAPQEAVAFLDSLDPRPVYYTITSKAGREGWDLWGREEAFL